MNDGPRVSHPGANDRLAHQQQTHGAAESAELATKATGLVSDMPRNPSPDLQQMESRVVKIVDLEREINAEIDELVDLKRDIRELIAQIRKPEYRTLLELRYLGFRTWDAIAEEMGFEPRTIYRFHSNALRVVERLMRAEKNS